MLHIRRLTDLDVVYNQDYGRIGDRAGGVVFASLDQGEEERAWTPTRNT